MSCFNECIAPQLCGGLRVDFSLWMFVAEFSEPVGEELYCRQQDWDGEDEDDADVRNEDRNECGDNQVFWESLDDILFLEFGFDSVRQFHEDLEEAIDVPEWDEHFGEPVF